MATFEDAETAVRTREVMRRISERVVGNNVPKPMVGRTTSVDLANLRATVWFIGDEQPMEVKLLPSSIPRTWASQYPAGTINTDTQGYGAMVLVEKFNGILYVTDVLTGASFADNPEALGLSVTEQVPDNGNGNMLGDRHASIIVVNTLSGSTIFDNEAVRFGPFMRFDDNTPQVGSITAKVISWSGQTRVYEFSVNLYEMVDATTGTYADRWWRIIPTRMIGDANGTLDEWDFDISIRETAGGVHGLVSNKEFWFRIVNRNSSSSAMDYVVTFETDLFQRARGWNQKFVAEREASGPDIMGYLGFHNAGLGFLDASSFSVMDEFGRTTSGAIGTSNTGEVWQDDAANGFCDGGRAVLQLTAANQSIIKTINPSTSPTLQDVDITGDISLSAAALGTLIRAGFVYRWTDSSNYYYATLDFLVGGNIDYRFNKVVAGVTSSIATGSTGKTYSAGNRLSLRVTASGSTHAIRVWDPLSQDETAQTLFSTTDASLSAAGRVGLWTSQAAGGTNTYPVNVRFHNFIASVLWSARNRNPSQVTWHTGPWRTALVRQAELLQRTLVFSATPTWAASVLSWSGRVVLGGIGRSRMGLKEGHAYITVPPNGWTIPKLPSNTSVTATASGVPLAAGQSLWVAIPPGVGNIDLRHYLFIVDETVFGKEFDMPEFAVLIAARPFDSTASSVLKLGNGSQL